MYIHDAGKGHCRTVKWILWYLLKIVDVSLVFKQDDTCDPYAIGFEDSNYAGDLDKWQSATGYVFTLVAAPISWKCTLQSTVVLSTIEAKYMVLIEVVNEAICLGGLLDEFGVDQKQILFILTIRVLFV